MASVLNHVFTWLTGCKKVASKIQGIERKEECMKELTPRVTYFFDLGNHSGLSGHRDYIIASTLMYAHLPSSRCWI